MHSLRGTWLFAIAGALLILFSTFILGAITFKAEQALLRTQKELEANKFQRQETQQYYDMAMMQVDLAVLQRLVIKYNAGQDVSLQKKSKRGYAEKLFSALLRLYIAAGNNALSQQQADDLKRVSTRAIEGGNEALEKLNSLILEMLVISNKHKEELMTRKAKLEKDENELTQSIISWRNWAIFLQIVGLVLLLTKEFPDYLLSPRKKEIN